MKYLITERQFRLLKEEDTEEPVAPKKIEKIHYEFFDNNWYELQDYLNRNKIRKKTPYVLVGNLNLKPAKVITLGSLVGVEGSLDLSFNKTIKDLGELQYVLGYLDLGRTNIESLGKLKYVSGSLDLRRTPLSGKTTEEEIRNIPNLTIGGRIYL